MNPAELASYAAGHPLTAAVAAALTITVLALIWRTVRHALRGRQPENVLTVVAAVIATAVQADGPWTFFRHVLHAPVWLCVTCFGFLEIAMFVSGLRARQNIRETPDHTAGVDGIAVWVLAGLSATIASTASSSVRIMLLRLVAAATAAWLWERCLAGDRRRARKADGGRGRRISLRITPERILVRLGIAESTDRTASDVDQHRRLIRVARAAWRLRVLQETEAKPRQLARAQRRLHLATEAAIEHADLATDSGRQDQLLAYLGALYGAAALSELTPAAPWQTPATRPAPRLYRVPASDRWSLDEQERDLPFETPAGLAAWLDEDRVPDNNEAVPAVPAAADEHHLTAARIFADEIQAGKVPGIRPIKRRIGVGQPKAREVQAYLRELVNQ